MVVPADALTPARVQPLLRGRFGRPYVYAETCATTQTRLDPGAPEGAAAVCEEQTAGRGRLGRRWEAPAGTAVLLSVLLRPPPERRTAELSLVGGVAVARAVEAAAPVNAGIKWPNDVVVAGRKVAGVLAETRADGAVVLGIGVNVNQREDELPPGGSLPAGSLRVATGAAAPRAPLLAGVLDELERAYEAWRRDGLRSLLPELAERDVVRGRHVRVRGVAGVATGIDETGRLLVGDVAVDSGEVEYDTRAMRRLPRRGTG